MFSPFPADHKIQPASWLQVVVQSLRHHPACRGSPFQISVSYPALARGSNTQRDQARIPSQLVTVPTGTLASNSRSNRLDSIFSGTRTYRVTPSDHRPLRPTHQTSLNPHQPADTLLSGTSTAHATLPRLKSRSARH